MFLPAKNVSCLPGMHSPRVLLNAIVNQLTLLV
jgi:hypothetical protein